MKPLHRQRKPGPLPDTGPKETNTEERAASLAERDYMKKARKKYLFRILLTLLLTVGILAAFWHFNDNNRSRITRQNEEYLDELTSQRAVSIDNLISENLGFIRSTAYLYGKSLSSSFADVAVIREYEENSVFDALRFVDKSGDNYTSRGVVSNLSDRDYYRRGMRGETGTVFVAESRVSGQRQIGFFSPVYFRGEIIGIMVGFYQEAFIRSLLEYELFGYEGEGWLCLRDGTVIGSTREETPENIFDYLEQSLRCTPEELQRLSRAVASGENSAFTYRDDGMEATGYVVGLKEADWILVRSFPPAASGQILHNANREGRSLMMELLGLFCAYGLILATGFMLEYRHVRAENRDANDISNGVSELFEKFVIIDLKSGEYRFVYGDPDLKHLAPTGPYASLSGGITAIVPEENLREEAELFFRADHLQQSLMEDDWTGIRLHLSLPMGEWFTFSLIVLERSSEDGTPSRLLMVRQNSTELYLREQAEQQRLQQALDEAEQASRAKTEFLFNMSHDIRTPMNAIMGFTGIAEKHLDDRERVKESLEKIDSSSRHLLSLINDVLDMSKIESGKLQLNTEEFSLSEAAEQLTDMIRAQTAGKNQKLTVSMDFSHDRIMGDPLRLNQILLNILSNAVKYTPEGGEILFRGKELSGDKAANAGARNIYEFFIKDTGIGMSADYLPHLFEDFTRERSSTVSRIQGTGLGMSIAKNLVDMMGGTIEVESELGKGSAFTVRIPAAPAESGASAGETAEDVFSPELVRGLRLLLAEDNPINTEIALIILGEAGFEIDVAENGQAALELIREKHEAYRAVLMDVQMPVMDGYESSAAIRRFEQEQGLGRIPIIAMTANSFEDDRRNAFAAGMDAHIAKPYQPDEMLQTVARFALKGCEDQAG